MTLRLKVTEYQNFNEGGSHSFVVDIFVPHVLKRLMNVLYSLMCT